MDQQQKLENEKIILVLKCCLLSFNNKINKEETNKNWSRTSEKNSIHWTLPRSWIFNHQNPKIL
jgi:hypothetical protein